MDPALRHHAKGTLSFRPGTSETGHDVRLVPLRPESLADFQMPLLLDRSLADDARGGDGLRHAGAGLTRAEGELAQALVEGATLAEVAELRGISYQLRLISSAPLDRATNGSRLGP